MNITEITDTEDAEFFNLSGEGVRSMLIVDKRLLAKLPKYAQGWNWSVLQKGAWGGREIDAICEPLADDERQDEQVSFICDNWTEFIWWVRQYNKERRRMN